MTTPSRDKVLRMDGWPGGMNNRMREYEQSTQRGGETIESSAFLRRALNVDLTAEGHPLRRPGRTLVSSGFAHSAFYSRSLDKYFVAQSGFLHVGDDVNSLSPFAAVNQYLRVSYAEHAGDVFWTNGKTSGRYGRAGAGVWPNPAMVPADPTAPEYDDNQSFEYVGPDAKHFHRALPVGQLVASHKGRLWVAQDNTLFISHAMQVDYHRAATELIVQPKYIQLMQPVDDGVYVGDDSEIRFIAGTDPMEVRQTRAYDYGVVPFATARLPGETFGVPFDEIPVWWTKDGVMSAGLPGGEVRQLTRDRLAVPEFSSGAVTLREREGMSQVVSSLQKGGDENNMAATDTIVAEIRRADC